MYFLNSRRVLYYQEHRDDDEDDGCPNKRVRSPIPYSREDIEVECDDPDATLDMTALSWSAPFDTNSLVTLDRNFGDDDVHSFLIVEEDCDDDDDALDPLYPRSEGKLNVTSRKKLNVTNKIQQSFRSLTIGLKKRMNISNGPTKKTLAPEMNEGKHIQLGGQTSFEQDGVKLMQHHTCSDNIHPKKPTPRRRLKLVRWVTSMRLGMCKKNHHNHKNNPYNNNHNHNDATTSGNQQKRTTQNHHQQLHHHHHQQQQHHHHQQQQQQQAVPIQLTGIINGGFVLHEIRRSSDSTSDDYGSIELDDTVAQFSVPEGNEYPSHMWC